MLKLTRLRYANFLTDKFDLRKHMQFNTRIASAHWQDGSNSWLLTDTNSRTYSSRFLITAMGILSQPTLPNIPGVRDFKGESFHSTRWPESPNLAGKRIGIIGTGATGTSISSIDATNLTFADLSSPLYRNPDHPRGAQYGHQVSHGLSTHSKLNRPTRQRINRPRTNEGNSKEISEDL
jgi:cation diffusion facilitator CzcD-associated flavoprotein CzcO